MKTWGTLVALLGTSALVQCGETTVVSSSESHFLQRCDSETDCGSLECLCGICSLPCENAADCGQFGAGVTCEASDLCRQESDAAQSLCLAPCSEHADCQEVGPDLVCEGEVCVSPSSGSLDSPCRSFYEVRLGAPACNDELECTALPTTLETGGPNCRATCADSGGCEAGLECNYGLCIPVGGAELCSSELIDEAERAQTPREDINLEQLALTLSDGIVADQGVYERLVQDVGRIRTEYPEVASISYFGSGAAALSLEVDEATLNDMEHGRYSDWNCLNRMFRAHDFNYVIFTSSTWALVYFDGVYALRQLAEAYAALARVESVSPESVGGDGPTICVARDADVWHYMFDEAGGDCPAGCTEHIYYYFRTDAEGTVVSGEPWIIDPSGEAPPAPEWTEAFEEAGYNVAPYSFCR